MTLRATSVTRVTPQTTEPRLVARREPGQDPVVSPGPALLAGIADGPGLAAHRGRFGPVSLPSADVLVELARAVDLRGRGGAGFPSAIKLASANRRKAVVVVNASEGEPASRKDAALMSLAPHVVLDGAAAVAHALGTCEVHLVVPSDAPGIRSGIERALRDRVAGGERIRWRLHDAAPRFVAGQAQAVLQQPEARPAFLVQRDYLAVEHDVRSPEHLRQRHQLRIVMRHVVQVARLDAVLLSVAEEHRAYPVPLVLERVRVILARQLRELREHGSHVRGQCFGNTTTPAEVGRELSHLSRP